MTPEQAARGLSLMQNYPEHVPDVPFDDKELMYRDLREFPLFSNCETVE